MNIPAIAPLGAAAIAIYLKEHVELAKEQPSFWQSYKFMNPVTKMVEPKQMYCERLDETAVCGGIYQ